MARFGGIRGSTLWRWLDEPLGGKRIEAIREEKPSGRKVAPEEADVQAETGPAPKPAAPAPTTAEVEVGQVYTRFEFTEDTAGPAAKDSTSSRAREYLGTRRDDLQDRCNRAVEESLGTGVRAGPVIVREGESIEVIVPLLATALTQSPWFEQALDALVQRIIGAVRLMLGRATPPMSPVAANGYFAPASVLLRPTPPEPSGERDDSKIARWLVGAGAFMTATLAVIGVTTADFDPIRINDGPEFSKLFAVILTGILIGVLWPILRRVVKRFDLVFLFFVVAAVGYAIWKVAELSTDSLSAKATPRIDVEVKQGDAGTRLVGTVAADGLKRSEQMRVRVSGIRGKAKPVVIHDTRAGPTNDGKTKVKLNVPVAVGRFAKLDVNADTDPEPGDQPKCADEPGEYGCVEASVPLGGRQPKITASWRTSKDEAPVLLVTAHMAGLSRTDKIRLVVRPRRKDGRLGARKFVAVWTSAPDGVLDESIEVAMQPKRAVCVIMRAKRSTKTSPSFTGKPYGPCAATSGAASVLLAPPPPPPAPAAATSG